MKLILFSLLLLVTIGCSANTLTQAQLSKAELQVSKLELKKLIMDIDKLTHQLGLLTSSEGSITAKSQALILLSQLQPTSEQQYWVLEQSNSKEVLKVTNVDHPEQLLEIVNIARQARNTQFQWQVNQKVENFEAQWLINNWQWGEFTQNPTELDYRALAKGVKNADKQTIGWLQEQLIEQAIKETSNRLLAILISGRNNPLLLTLLWHNSSDQYSYKVLQQLNTLLPPEQAIKQLTQASDNDKLLSQSLLLLSKHYQHNEMAQDFLIKKLQQSKSAWHAATALSQTSNSQLQQKVQALALKSNKDAVKFAVKQISKNKEAKE